MATEDEEATKPAGPTPVPPSPSHEGPDWVLLPLKARAKADKLRRAAAAAAGREEGSSSSEATEGRMSSHSSFSNMSGSDSGTHTPVISTTPLRVEEGLQEYVDDALAREERVVQQQTHPVARDASAAPRQSRGRSKSEGNVHAMMPRANAHTSSGEGSVSGEESAPLSKKEIRMMKNRESAARSRKRKRDLMEGLEATVRDLTKRNEELKSALTRYVERFGRLEDCTVLQAIAAGGSGRVAL